MAVVVTVALGYWTFRRIVVPLHFKRLLLTHFAEVLALDAVLGADEMLQEILVALAGGTEEIGAPDKEVARKVLWRVGVFA